MYFLINSNGEVLSELLSSGMFLGIKLKGRTPVMAYKDKLIDELVESLRTRFDFESDSVVTASRICNIKSWPQLDSDQIDGRSDVKNNIKINNHIMNCIHAYMYVNTNTLICPDGSDHFTC